MENSQTAAATSGASVSLINVRSVGSLGSVAISPMQSSVPVVDGRRVLITPLRAHQHCVASSKQPFQERPAPLLQDILHQPPKEQRKGAVIQKVLLKAVTKSKKSQKTFTLRDIDTGAVVSRDTLKNLIRTQLNQEIVASNKFDVGFIQGSTVVNIRSKEDLRDVWSDILKVTGGSCKVMLWCDGLKEDTSGSRKRQCQNGSDDDGDLELNESSKPSKKRKTKADKAVTEEKVQENIDSLKEKHGSKFTEMQYSIWGEMLEGGYPSTEDPPGNSMFSRAGGGQSKRTESASMTRALTDVACAITGALSPKQCNSSGKGSNCSPMKVIESRSKLYKQLGELNNLMTMGVLSDEEYTSEKEVIMDLLKKINS